MEKCKNCADLSIRCQELETKYNDLYKTFEDGRKSREEHCDVITRVARGDSVAQTELIKSLRTLMGLTLRDAKTLADKLALQTGRVCNMPNCGI